MASLRDAVKDYQDELRAGIAWVAFWREGRSWHSDYIYLEMDDTLTPEDRGRLREIQEKDPAAVVLNGYYCGYLGEDYRAPLSLSVTWEAGHRGSPFFLGPPSQAGLRSL